MKILAILPAALFAAAPVLAFMNLFSKRAAGTQLLSRVFDLLQKHAVEYCTFDDYNWDWSIVYLQNNGMLPHSMLMPSKVLAKHIGIKEGMHTDKNTGETYSAAFPEYVSRMERLDTQYDARRFTGDVNPSLPTEHGKGFGCWGHPKDHEHCINVLTRKA